MSLTFLHLYGACSYFFSLKCGVSTSTGVYFGSGHAKNTYPKYSWCIWAIFRTQVKRLHDAKIYEASWWRATWRISSPQKMDKYEFTWVQEYMPWNALSWTEKGTSPIFLKSESSYCCFCRKTLGMASPWALLHSQHTLAIRRCFKLS